MIYIAQELLPNGDLYDYLTPIRASGEHAIRLFARQIMLGVKHMKDHGYTHRDIKLENICLDSNFTPKIIDWGFAKRYEPGDQTNTLLGTPVYMAPEILNRQNYDPHKADMFALGVLLFAIKKNNYPWVQASQNDQSFRMVMQDQHDDFWTIH